MKNLTKGAIVATILTIVWSVCFTFVLINAINNGSSAETVDFIVIPIIGYGPLIAPIILWIKVFKEGGPVIDLKKFKKPALIILIDLVILGIGMILSRCINIDINSNFSLWLAVQIISMYFCYWGTTFLLKILYLEENDFPTAIIVIFSIVYVMLGGYGSYGMSNIVSGLVQIGKIESGSFLHNSTFVMVGYLPIVTLISCIIKKSKHLNDWIFAFIFILGPLVAIAIPLLFIFGYFSLFACSGSSSSDSNVSSENNCETETHYYLDDANHSEVHKCGSGASEHWEDESGNMYKEDRNGNIHQVDSMFDNVDD